MTTINVNRKHAIRLSDKQVASTLFSRQHNGWSFSRVGVVEEDGRKVVEIYGHNKKGDVVYLIWYDQENRILNVRFHDGFDDEAFFAEAC